MHVTSALPAAAAPGYHCYTAGADQGGAVTSHAAAEKTLSYGPPLVTSPWRHMPRVTSAQRHTAPLAARPAMHVKTSLSRELGGSIIFFSLW